MISLIVRRCLRAVICLLVSIIILGYSSFSLGAYIKLLRDQTKAQFWQDLLREQQYRFSNDKISIKVRALNIVIKSRIINLDLGSDENHFLYKLLEFCFKFFKFKKKRKFIFYVSKAFIRKYIDFI